MLMLLDDDSRFDYAKSHVSRFRRAVARRSYTFSLIERHSARDIHYIIAAYYAFAMPPFCC